MKSPSWISAIISGAMLLSAVPTHANEIAQPNDSLSSLPNGLYRFTSDVPIGPRAANRHLQFVKIDNVAIGYDVAHYDDNPCFAGMIEQDQIVNVRLAYPPYGRGTFWSFEQQTEPIDLSDYPHHSSIEDERELRDCITAFTTMTQLVDEQSMDGFMFHQDTLNAQSEIMESDGSRYRSYYLPGQAGQRLTISMLSDEVDPYLIVLDANGRKVAENDDISQENLNAQVTVTLPSTDSYRIIVNTSGANDYGRYLVTVVPTARR